MKTTIFIITAMVFLTGGIVIGYYLPSKAESNLGATCSLQTFSQQANAKCKCPDPIVVVNGCTNGISGTKTIKIMDATNVILENNKNYLINDITKSAIKSTSVLSE